MMAACPKTVGIDLLHRTQAMLGGAKLLGCSISSAYEVHDLIVRGLPLRAVRHLARSLGGRGGDPSLPSALGISRRTFKRWQDAPGATRLSVAQSGRIWVLAETLALAIGVLGSQDDAVAWLWRPVASFDGRRPVELLATPMGAKLVADHLHRLEHGVYT